MLGSNNVSKHTLPALSHVSKINNYNKVFGSTRNSPELIKVHLRVFLLAQGKGGYREVVTPAEAKLQQLFLQSATSRLTLKPQSQCVDCSNSTAAHRVFQ